MATRNEWLALVEGFEGAGMTFAKLELLAGAVILVMAAIFHRM